MDLCSCNVIIKAQSWQETRLHNLEIQHLYQGNYLTAIPENRINLKHYLYTASENEVQEDYLLINIRNTTKLYVYERATLLQVKKSLDFLHIIKFQHQSKHNFLTWMLVFYYFYLFKLFINLSSTMTCLLKKRILALLH